MNSDLVKRHLEMFMMIMGPEGEAMNSDVVKRHLEMFMMIMGPGPCPFCGCNPPELEEVEIRTWAVCCPSCHAVGPHDAGQDKPAALQRWNDLAGILK